jgi:hypothetical protein
VAVVISYEEYTRLREPKNNLVEFFRISPLVEADLDLARDRSPSRHDVQ